MTLVSIGVGCVAVVLLAHALFSLLLMLHAWDQPERLRSTGGPESFREPQLSFTVLVPARGEEAVIGETITRLWTTNYPPELREIIVICQRDDLPTIAAAQRQIAKIAALCEARAPRSFVAGVRRAHMVRGRPASPRFPGRSWTAISASASRRWTHARRWTPTIRLAIYDERPFNKPHALRVGYAASSGDVVAIFDAEDDVHRDIFQVINTVMLDDKAGVVQGGVQLMNFRDHWFSVFNCLEYFFYFKSKLHFNARVGMVPLGGNTVFLRRELVERVGGWDAACLTEDADIGLRVSALGERIRVVYDSRWVTREETPHTVRALVKQRTRWHQGFLQILGKGDWRRLLGWRRRLLALVTFAQPMLDAVLLCSVPLMPIAVFWLKLPVAVALLSLAPLYAVGLQMLANMCGAVVFARLFNEPLPWRVVLRMPFTYLPYQWLIAFSAMRATVRHARGEGDWEKTEHRGAHRRSKEVPVLRPVGASDAPMVVREEVA